jgi:subtilase family protein
MDIMRHRQHFYPAVARVPGGADYPVAVDETFPPLPPATDITVGVVDTGIVLDEAREPHRWFSGHVRFGADDEDALQVGAHELGGPGYLADADGHGTFVSGLILREAPTARIEMRGALDKASQHADFLGSEEDEAVAAAVRAIALDPDVQVINLSFGGGVFADAPKSLGRVLAGLDDRIAVVAAAGNDGRKDTPVWPAAFDGVISVGALDERRARPPEGAPPRASFSNYGSWVDAYAGGVQLLGPFVYFDEADEPDEDGKADEVDEYLVGPRPPQRFRGWARWSGTSFAAAVVSGRIARIAAERDITGAQAAWTLLDESRRVFHDGAAWIRQSS